MSPSLQRGRRAGAALLLVVAAFAFAPAATATADPGPTGPCTDADGVTVVVDLTELGGSVEVGCAASAATGAEALTAAGFTDTRDASGLVCALESAPEPCPTEFTGTYWSYWTATPDGAWTMSMEGPDTTVPAPGSLEGWRYGDGSAGPTIAPADALAAPADAPTQEAAEPTADATTDATVTATDGADTELAVQPDDVQPDDEGVEDTPAWLVVVIGVAAVGLGAAVLVGLSRRRRDTFGPSGQD
jgi:hypothetical protein